ncbi:T-lymphocyte surface antigen Ly-9-like isoform X2 [Talpa occidentalis]|uniref:T-lymphocyte surface antigen Ly-9-like isoform X2 n=1 Tax=Talpa occidentalis TaxID=50954 RepID=UPI00188FE250|nr:T-lymphocyte surface antigen Ly-9-like isoform X2 [Talpa occidentalis]XP_054547237.1 T-lymphocyte surface antigen Ly-9-like isoform X2 [Talpa occidentalis]
MDRQPGMGPCPGNPHLCRVSRALGLASLLLSICSPGAKSSEAHGSGVKGSEANNPVKGTQGGAVWFHMNTNPGAELEKILWGFFPQSAYVIMLEVHRGAEDAPTWCNLWDKYGQRVHVPNMTSLRIENLTSEDSGRYWAQAMLPGGGEMSQLFQLTVYEPVPLPQIVTESLSLTPDWCNVTLECRIMRDGENLSVTWESQGLLGGLERRPPPGPARSSWILAVSQPLSQPHASLTCVVSNPVDQKTVTKALGEVCAPGAVAVLPQTLLPQGADVVTPHQGTMLFKDLSPP